MSHSSFTNMPCQRGSGRLRGDVEIGVGLDRGGHPEQARPWAFDGLGQELSSSIDTAIGPPIGTALHVTRDQVLALVPLPAR